MPPEHTSPITNWTSLAAAADTGQLYLDPDAARQCHAACQTYIYKLTEHKEKAETLSVVEGFGSFPSGIELAERFSKKAAGGANNLVDVLQSHIDVVTQMQVVFQKLMAATTDVDQGNSASIASQLPN